MNTFRNNFTLGQIKEVGEESVLVNVKGEDMEFSLDDSNKQPIFDAVSEGVYMIPVDVEKRKLLMTVDTQTLYEVFPETELEALKDAVNDEYEIIDGDE